MEKEHRKFNRIFGFGKDREGLITRYINEEKNWKAHLDNTKEYIIKSAEKKSKGSCMILGSGWWLDIPIQELEHLFDVLIFVDISHPKQIIHKVRKHPKIKLITTDISGVLRELTENDNFKSFMIKENKSRTCSFDLINKLNPDFVISLNLLSQIAYFPVRYLKNKKNLPTEELENIGRFIEEKHKEILPAEKSCIITDYYQLEYDFKDNLINEQSRLRTNLPENDTLKRWTWDFDLKGNYIQGKKVKFKVAALQV